MIVAMAAIVGFTFNTFSGKGLPLLRVAPEKVAVTDSAIFGSPGTTPASIPAADAVADSAGSTVFRIITLEQMKRAVDEKRGLLLDARTPDEYAAGHIPGAMNLYAEAPETWVERIAEIPRDTLVLVYCGNPHCPYGRTLAEFLGQFGFTNLLLYDEGWDQWSGAGLPAAKGGE